MNFKNIASIVGVSIMLSGCLSKSFGLLPRDEPFTATKESKKALVIGSVEEEHLTKSYGTLVVINNLDETKDVKNLLLTTIVMAEVPDYRDPFHTKFYFVFEVPEGEYGIKEWLLRDYDRNKKSEVLNPPVKYKFESGKVYYLGHFFADTLDVSLGLRDNYADDVAKIKKKYIHFPQQEVINTSKQHLFENWKLIDKE